MCEKSSQSYPLCIEYQGTESLYVKASKNPINPPVWEPVKKSKGASQKQHLSARDADFRGPCTADAKVCIVDDDRSIVDCLRGLLASEKIEAVTFDNPGQFLDYVQVHDTRVAILDRRCRG
jgi:hypothetical protein